MSRTHLVASLAAAATALAVLAGCSSSGNDAKNSSPATDSPSSSASSSPSTSASSSASSSATSQAADGALEAALLTATDVGAGYQPTDTGTTDSPLPCTPTEKPLFTQAPPAQKVQKSFVNGASTVQVGETVAEFSADTGAEQAFTLGQKGFTCAQGVIGGAKVQIVKRAGAAPSGIDDLAAWDFAAGQQKGTAVIARIGGRIAALTFSAVGTAGDAVPVGDIVARALAKVAALK